MRLTSPSAAVVSPLPSSGMIIKIIDTFNDFFKLGKVRRKMEGKRRTSSSPSFFGVRGHRFGFCCVPLFATSYDSIRHEHPHIVSIFISRSVASHYRSHRHFPSTLLYRPNMLCVSSTETVRVKIFGTAKRIV